MKIKTIVKNMVIPKNKRIIAISDIHGHYCHLKGLLRKVSFTNDDILFIVGDIIEKGPDSLKTLQYVMKLSKNNNVYPIIGNVDASIIFLFDDTSKENSNKFFNYIEFRKKWWNSCLFSEMCDKLDIKIVSPDDVTNAKSALNQHFRKEFDFIRSLPTLIETQNFIFVHGGLPTNNLVKYEDYDLHKFTKIDGFMDKGICFEKYIVVGHWPVTLYNDKIQQSNPIINTKQKIISIDGGCGIKNNAQLNALIIPTINTNKFSYNSFDNFTVGYAKTAQQKSINSINIRWPDIKIEILEKGNEVSTVKHKTSGAILKIPNCFIGDFGENAYCNEYSDYFLEVNKGDKLSIVKKTKLGYIVKKNGVSGWYTGEIVFDNK